MGLSSKQIASFLKENYDFSKKYYDFYRIKWIFIQKTTEIK